MSMSSKHCQSDLEAALAIADTAAVEWGDIVGRWPSILPTRGLERRLESRNAAGAWSRALRRLRPP